MTGRALAWEAVADRVRHAIASGDIPAGGLLPSLRDLASRHGVSIPTVRAAVRHLAEDGLVSPEPGRGVRVLDGTATVTHDVLARLAAVEEQLRAHLDEHHQA